MSETCASRWCRKITANNLSVGKRAVRINKMKLSLFSVQIRIVRLWRPIPRHLRQTKLTSLKSHGIANSLACRGSMRPAPCIASRRKRKAVCPRHAPRAGAEKSQQTICRFGGICPAPCRAGRQEKMTCRRQAPRPKTGVYAGNTTEHSDHSSASSALKSLRSFIETIDIIQVCTTTRVLFKHKLSAR